MFLLCSYAQPKPLSLNIWYARSLRDKPYTRFGGIRLGERQEFEDFVRESCEVKHRAEKSSRWKIR